jgi:aminoglycoside phosphotransferase (APT) family kinase protein
MLATELIISQFDLHIESITAFGRGWDNYAYLVNNNIVFRFPHREVAIACMENEIHFLPYLAKKISFPFSCPVYIGRPTPKYPFVFSGYPLLVGKMLVDFDPQEVNNVKTAQALAEWLRELHAIPVLNKHQDLFQGNQNWRLDVPDRIAHYTENLIQYSSYFESSGFVQKDLQEHIDNLRHFNFDNVKTSSYLHGDLYYKHLIADDALTLVGLIDWGDIHIGSPGIDLSAAIILFEGEPLAHFWESYQGMNETVLKMAAFRAFCHEMSMLPYAYEQKDEKNIRWAQVGLKRAIEAIRRSDKR